MAPAGGVRCDNDWLRKAEVRRLDRDGAVNDDSS